MSAITKTFIRSGFYLPLACSAVVATAACNASIAAPITTSGALLEPVANKLEGTNSVDSHPLQTADGKDYQITRTVVNASPEDVFTILVDYGHSGLLFSSLTKSAVLSRDEANKTSNVSFSLKGIMNLWSFDYVLSIKENFPSSIEFHRLSGAFKRNEGYWSLLPLDNGRRTEVVYAKYIDAGLVLPPQIVAKQVHDSTLAVVENLKRVAENPKPHLASHG